MAVINASQINSRAGETLYRVSRDLDVLKCWIDPHKVIRDLVVIRHRLAGRADGSVAMRIRAHPRLSCFLIKGTDGISGGNLSLSEGRNFALIMSVR